MGLARKLVASSMPKAEQLEQLQNIMEAQNLLDDLKKAENAGQSPAGTQATVAWAGQSILRIVHTASGAGLAALSLAGLIVQARTVLESFGDVLEDLDLSAQMGENLDGEEDDHPLWCINAQITELLQGNGASEDLRDVMDFLRSTGLPESTVERMHAALCFGDSKFTQKDLEREGFRICSEEPGRDDNYWKPIEGAYHQSKP